MKSEQPSLSLNLIGAGNLGKSLARLWHDHDLLSVKQVFTTNQLTAQAAVEFIGVGVAHTNIDEIERSDILLIAAPDDQIELICNDLLDVHHDLENTIIFHCSGVLSSMAIDILSARGASIASIHPIKSFAHPDSAITSFSGTFCGVEGDQTALNTLIPLFSKLGGNCLAINPDNKALYHCAAVFANNYMVSLVECAQELYQLSGINRDQSIQLLAPMLRETCENLINFGTEDSLTGPIDRGDTQTIEKHLNALSNANNEINELYRSLGKVALHLKNRKGETTNGHEILRLLSSEK